MKTNTTIHCDQTCESQQELKDQVTFASGGFLVVVGITSAFLNIKALIKAAKVDISFFNVYEYRSLHLQKNNVNVT